jgi:hypothetical protein
VNYPDNVQEIIDRVMADFEAARLSGEEGESSGPRRFKKSLFQKVVAAYISK